MRRAQIDVGSQPVRNHWTNPGFETGSANVAVRTNLATYPNMTASTGVVTVRTNIVRNGRPTTGTSNWSSGQTLTRTQDGNGVWWMNAPSGTYTYALGVGIVGRYYAASMRVKAPAGTVVNTFSTDNVVGQFLSSASVTVPAEGEVVIKLTSTVAVSGTSLYFGLTGVSVSGVMLTDMYMEEVTTTGQGVYGNFFDGATPAAGDFTYAWTGTAYNSSSAERGTNVAGWTSRWHGATGGSGLTYQSTDNPLDGIFQRKLWKTANTGAAADTGTALTTRVPVVAGTTYTASIMARCSVAQRFSIFYDWHDAAGAVLSRQGPTDLGAMSTSWTRFSYSATAPANAVTANVVFGPYTNATPMPVGATLDFDQCLIESHNAVLPYFDGSTAAAGDFTYTWTGTAAASSSFQRGVGLPAVTSGNSMAIQSSEWSASGTKSLRIVANTQFNTSSAIMLSGAQLERGKTYTAIATRRLTAPLTGTLSAYAGAIIFVHTSVGTYYSNFIVNSAGIGVAKLKFFLADNGTSWTLRLGHGGSAGSGEVWWDNFMVVEGDYTGGFIDPGVTPFSKWDGTAHASTSVGYPPSA